MMRVHCADLRDQIIYWLWKHKEISFSMQTLTHDRNKFYSAINDLREAGLVKMRRLTDSNEKVWGADRDFIEFWDAYYPRHVRLLQIEGVVPCD